MEPADVMPLHSAFPPQLNDKGDGEAGLEEEEFEDLGEFSTGVSWSPLGFAQSTNSPSSLRQPSPTLKPATHQPDCSFNHPVKQSQPTASVNLGSGKSQTDVEGKDCYTESCVHLTNGYSESAHQSGNHTASAVSVCAPREETGFADFTVFAEQAAHPWCCGFTPLGNTEKWDGRAVGTDSLNRQVKQICDPGREVFMDSEPGPHCACKAEEKHCPGVRSCVKRNAPAQDHHEPQEIAGALDFPPEEPNFGEVTSGRDSQRCNRSASRAEVQENGELEEERGDQEKSISAAPETFSLYDSVSEDLASSCDDFSFEGPSADLEPNVSSLGSEEQTDWDQTGDEEEEVGNYSSPANLRQSRTERGLQYSDPSTTQETSSTSNQSQHGTHTESGFAEFKDCSLERDRDPGHVQTVDAGVLILGTLPPSDSFADFCSAPMQDEGAESSVGFKEQKFQERGRTWSREQVSSLQTEDEDRAGQYRVTRSNSCEVTLSGRVQQLLLASFPVWENPAAEERRGAAEEEVLTLGALLHTQHLPESEKEEILELCPAAQRIQRGVWWPHQDLHTAVGLKFHWEGSHANVTLLRCLGVDTKKVFIGIKKQPVTVPAFASNLGMLEHTKESVSAVCSPGHTAVTAQAPPGLQDSPAPSTDSVHEVLPSNRLDWSSRGLSSSQDGTSPHRAPHFWGRK